MFKQASVELEQESPDFEQACDSLLRSAKQEYQPSCDKLVELMKVGNFYSAKALYQLACYLEENNNESRLLKQLYKTSIKKAGCKEKKFNSKDGVKRQVVMLFEDIFKKGIDKNILYEIAWLRYHGEIFERNYFIAFELFDRAQYYHDTRAHYFLGKMYFDSDGTSLDLDKAEKHLYKYIQNSSDENKYIADANYRLGEIYYARYLIAKDDKENESIDRCLSNAVKYFEKSLQQESKEVQPDNKALLSLEIAAYDNNSEQAKGVLNYFHLSEKLEASSMPESLSAGYSALDDNDPQVLQEQLHNKDENTTAIIEKLTKHYKVTEDGILNVLSTLCYVGFRYPVTSCYMQNLHKLLHEVCGKNRTLALEEKLTDDALEEYRRQLKTIEAKESNYYDEYGSDISDSEDDERRQETDRRLTRAVRDADEIIKRFEKDTLELLQRLFKLADHTDEKKYKKLKKDIKFKLTSIRHSCPVGKKSTSEKEKILEDINTLNFYKARGKLAEGLKLVPNNYVVALVRGHHFDTKRWNQKQRRSMRKMIIDRNHPFVDRDMPVYSSAVYEHAKITNFSDCTLRTRLKLAKSALALKMRMHLRFYNKPTFSDSELQQYSDPVKQVLEKRTATLHREQQIQQLYTNEYKHFFEYLENEIKIPDSTFSNTCNPKISFARVPIAHSSGYAGGTKYYHGQEETRLMPRWDKNLRPQRRNTGYVMLGLFPLDDLVTEHYADVVAMVTADEIRVNEMILNEQEFSFDIATKPGRIKYIDLFKYPPFNRSYLRIDRVKYFLSKELFKRFKEALKIYKPHAEERCLVRLLLGTYLCATQNYFLVGQALSDAGKDPKKQLLFLDRNGMFALKPSYDISPSPHGDGNDKIAKRYRSAKLRTDFFLPTMTEPTEQLPPRKKLRRSFSNTVDNVLCAGHN